MLEGYIPMDPVIMEANEYGITEYYLNMEEYEKNYRILYPMDPAVPS